MIRERGTERSNERHSQRMDHPEYKGKANDKCTRSLAHEIMLDLLGLQSQPGL